jgi:hypothetical protein
MQDKSEGGMVSNDDDHGRIAREMIRKTAGLEGVFVRHGTWGENKIETERERKREREKCRGCVRGLLEMMVALLGSSTPTPGSITQYY